LSILVKVTGFSSAWLPYPALKPNAQVKLIIEGATATPAVALHQIEVGRPVGRIEVERIVIA